MDSQRSRGAGVGPLPPVNVECGRDGGRLFKCTKKETCSGHGEKELSLPGLRAEFQLGMSQEATPRGKTHQTLSNLVLAPCPAVSLPWSKKPEAQMTYILPLR